MSLESGSSDFYSWRYVEQLADFHNQLVFGFIYCLDHGVRHSCRESGSRMKLMSSFKTASIWPASPTPFPDNERKPALWKQSNQGHSAQMGSRASRVSGSSGAEPTDRKKAAVLTRC